MSIMTELKIALSNTFLWLYNFIVFFVVVGQDLNFYNYKCFREWNFLQTCRIIFLKNTNNVWDFLFKKNVFCLRSRIDENVIILSD